VAKAKEKNDDQDSVQRAFLSAMLRASLGMKQAETKRKFEDLNRR
jgi:hypothetical protein